MLSFIRRRASFVNVIAVFALVFAMAGGAYAAKKYVITSTSQIKPSVLKSLHGKAGPAGAAGAAGAAGPQGPQGPAGSAGAGKEGKEGPQGKEGPSGKNGGAGATGPTGRTGPEGERGTTGPKGATGTTGAIGVTGPAGTTGPEGVCATSACVLPSGASEKGVWSATMSGSIATSAGQELPFAISFPVPLAAHPEKAFYCTEEQTETGSGECTNANTHAVEASGCTGSESSPTAPEGVLCLYTASEEFAPASTGFFSIKGPGIENGGGTTGAIIRFRTTGTAKEALLVKAYGSFAVTAK